MVVVVIVPPYGQILPQTMYESTLMERLEKRHQWRYILLGEGDALERSSAIAQRPLSGQGRGLFPPAQTLMAVTTAAAVLAFCAR